MNVLTIVVIGFLILEATNVVALYFFPDSKLAKPEQLAQDPR